MNNLGMKAVGNMIKNIFNGVGKVAYGVSLLSFVYPTFVRRTIEKHKLPRESDLWGISFFGTFVLDAIYCVTLCSYGANDCLTSLPLATHTVSGLYEWYRYEKNKKSSSTMTTTTPVKGLEASVEKAEEVKQEQSPGRSVVNPWEIDVRKIENLVER